MFRLAGPTHLKSFCLVLLTWAFGFTPTGVLAADPPPTGFQNEVRIAKPTRLDWEFVAAGFGKKALTLPASFQSMQQRFQLHVPKTYDPVKAWPLVVFISPGDAPLGWRYWQKTCEKNRMLFCAAYGAGNNCHPGQRIRIVLDMLDQVRRDYRIDPELTYLTGFSGGGRVACTIAFAMPEYFGGVVPICGTNPLNPLDYLRHRVQDRLSVAFVTGSKDFNRDENEKFQFPFFQDLGIRSKLWVVSGMGHGIPSTTVLDEVEEWLTADLARRREDVKKRPLQGIPPDRELGPDRLAERLLEVARAELKQEASIWRGVVLLQGIVARWSTTDAGKEARKGLTDIQNDPRLLRLAGEQGGQEERQVLFAQARGFERVGELSTALEVWKVLGKEHASSTEGRQAAAEIARLSKLLAARPFLGISFVGESTKVERVILEGPADRAGLQPGDVIRMMDAEAINSLRQLQQVLSKHKPGDRVKLEVEREGKRLTLPLQIGSQARSES